MNTSNLQTGNLNVVSATSTNILKTSQPPTQLLQPNAISAIIATNNERINHNTNSLNNTQNHESATQSSMTAFTIHTSPQPIQVIPSLVNSVNPSGSVPPSSQLSTNVNANPIIHPATIGITAASVPPSSVVCTATILPTGNGQTQQVTSIPIHVSTTIHKTQSPAPPISSLTRFPVTNVYSSSGSSSLVIHHQDHSAPKNPHVVHSGSSHYQPQQHITASPVINATVSMTAPTVTVQPVQCSGHTTPAPLFIQAANPATNAILQPSVSHNPTSQPTNLSTSSAQQQSQNQAPALQQQQFQRLKVEDALSYLDQVKYKFNDQPQVYNDFLDIMKEFKSQSIDTPGVIQRVSTLFKGHPELIVGFNTFLPPGYKIEIHSNDQVNVSMPNSTNFVLMPNPLSSHHQQQPTVVPQSALVSGANVHSLQTTLPRAGIVSGASTANIHTITHGQTYSNNLPASRDPNSMTPSNNSLASARVDLASHNNNHHKIGYGSIETSKSSTIHSSSQNCMSPNGPVEFNHAITYVNKIKNRFLEQPEIYKQFLDILQSYQKEQDNSGQKILSESEVFSKVSKLFENQPDLLQEFSQFLPDAHGGSTSHHNSAALISSQHSTLNLQNSSYSVPSSNQVSVNYGHTVSLDNSYSQQSSNVTTAEHSFIKKTMLSMNSNSVISNNRTLSAVSSNTFINRMQKRSNCQFDQANSHLSIKRTKSSSNRETSGTESGKYLGDLFEYAFFDKLRNALNCQLSYENFLRCLILFNNDLLSSSELLHLVQPQFSHCPELYKRLKEMLGIREGSLSSSLHHNTVHGNSSFNNSYQTFLDANSLHLPFGNKNLNETNNRSYSALKDFDADYFDLDYSSTKRFGSSYRTVPKNNSKTQCSGRTPLCDEVLNDTLVSFPSWSEDSTFVSSRKTQYEEYIYRCEDERYELDLTIQSNRSTIHVLDSVLNKLKSMGSEERSNFRLDDSLGGNSKILHIKSIERVYGSEYCNQIIEGIKSTPEDVIPVVIQRLSDKQDEWREVQRKRNRLWREQNEKFYLKSLDHQGITFKQNDTKYLRTKSLLNEIETIAEKRETDQQKSEESCKEISENSSDYHMICQYPDNFIIDTACNLIIHHVKRQTSIHKEEKMKIKQLMKHFIPDLFSTPRGDLSDDEVEEENGKDEKSTSKQFSETKHLIDSKIETEKSHLTCSKSTNEQHTILSITNNQSYSLFFANNPWYYFFRLHHILCERLSKMDTCAKKLSFEKSQNNLNLTPLAALGMKNYNENKNASVDYFKELVEMVKQVLDGNLDSNIFEDNLRELFGIHAYIAFTLDKIVQSIVRQLQNIVTEEISQKCTDFYLDFLKSLENCDLSSSSIQTLEESYKNNSEEMILSEENNCFKIIVFKKLCKVVIDLVQSPSNDNESNGNDDTSVPRSSRTLRSSTKNMSDREREKCLNDMKLDSLVLSERLEANPLFLKRCVLKDSHKNETCDDEDDNGDVKNIYIEQINEMSTDDKLFRSRKTLAGKNENQGEFKKTCKLDLDNFKKILVVKNHTTLYRNYFSNKKTRRKRSKIDSTRFKEWHKKWLLKNAEKSSTKELNFTTTT